MSEAVITLRLSEDLRKKLEAYCDLHQTTAPSVLRSLLELHLDEKNPNRFLNYEMRYLKYVAERTIYNTYMIMEHLKREKDPTWDGKEYNKFAKTKAYETERGADIDARTLFEGDGPTKADDKTQPPQARKTESENERER